MQISLSPSKKRIIDGICTALCAAIILYQIVYNIIPLRQAMYYLRLDAISPLLAILGFVAVGWDVLSDRYCFKAKHTWSLIAVIGVLCVSAVVHINYSIVDNAKSVIWQIVQMLLIYPLATRISEQSMSKFIFIIYLITTGIFSVAIVISLVQLFMLTAYEVIALSDGGVIRQGFYEGRLRGVFCSPYFPTLISGLQMIGSVYYFKKHKNVYSRIIYVLFAVLAFLYIALSGTRSIQVGLAVAMAVFALFKSRNCLNLLQKPMHTVLKAAVCIAVACAVAIGSFFAVSFVEKGVKELVVAVNGSDGSSSLEPGSDNMNTDDPNIMLYRPDTEGSDVSNHRFEIWSNYVEVTADSVKSLFFGYTSGEYMSIVADKYPDKYIVSYMRENFPNFFEQGVIYDAHNAYLSIFVMSGVLGTLAMAVFFFLCIKKVLKYVYKNKVISGTVLCLITLLVTILADAFFDSDLFFRCTSSSVVFWLLAGVIINKTDALEKPVSTEISQTEKA